MTAPIHPWVRALTGKEAFLAGRVIRQGGGQVHETPPFDDGPDLPAPAPDHLHAKALNVARLRGLSHLHKEPQC